MLYKVDIWGSQSGQWYAGNTSDLGHNSNAWYIPARILGLTPAGFIEFLINEFHPDYIHYCKEKNFLSYSWSNQVDCNRWKLFINKEARKKSFQI